MGRVIKVDFHEDNQAMIRVCETGRNPTMRHLGRVHSVDIAWLHERFQSDLFALLYTTSDRMRADVFTKGYTNSDKWRHAHVLIGVFDYPQWLSSPQLAMGGGESFRRYGCCS